MLGLWQQTQKLRFVGSNPFPFMLLFIQYKSTWLTAISSRVANLSAPTKGKPRPKKSQIPVLRHKHINMNKQTKNRY